MNGGILQKGNNAPQDYPYLNSHLRCHRIVDSMDKSDHDLEKKKMKNIISNAKLDFFRHSQGISTEYTID
jgi:hypothetical protein